MSSVDLYDFSPVLQLMVVGLALASAPLAWVWLRSQRALPRQRLRMLTLLTLFLTFDLVLFGAFTRLTDSGLGCPDWPGCYGSASPLGAQVHITAAETAMPSGPVTHPKAWIEMIHRYLATAVGVLILTLTAATWAARRTNAPQNVGNSGVLSLWWPLLTLFWVCLQGAFGALTVTMKLFPAIVTLHLLGGLVLLALLRVQSIHYSRDAGIGSTLLPSMPAGMGRWVVVAFGLLWLQIALGGWVSTNYAVLACTEFPACQGSFWPPMDISGGFSLWRSLGSDGEGGNISFQALTAIHYVHRLSAYVVFVVFMAISVRLHREVAFKTTARWLGGLMLLQVITGMSNVVLDWPLVAAVAHTGGAAALVVVMTGLVCAARLGKSKTTTVDTAKSGFSRLPA